MAELQISAGNDGDGGGGGVRRRRPTLVARESIVCVHERPILRPVRSSTLPPASSVSAWRIFRRARTGYGGGIPRAPLASDINRFELATERRLARPIERKTVEKSMRAGRMLEILGVGQFNERSIVT